jgi:sigma-B regulation protein RsbU (phosphoserine phosphatase)
MAVSRSLIRGNAHRTESPAETLRQANHLILADSQSGMFVTVYYLVLHPGGRVSCVNAGHNLPIVYHAAEGTHELLPRGGRALGWFDDLPVETLELQLAPGDMIVLYTDGVSEAENAQGGYFGEKRLVEAVCARRGRPATDVLYTVNAAVDAFVGDAPPFDDRTLVVVRYTGEA